MTWKAQIRGVENLAPEMTEAFHAGVQRGLEALGSKGTEIVVENIRTPYGDLPPAVAFGHLAGSITPSFVQEMDLATEIIGVSPDVGADVYAGPVETGARPHMPPASALLPWVMKKFDGIDEKSALSLAFAIAKTIAAKGTQGHFMFERALEALEPLAPEALETAIAQAFAERGFKGGLA